MQTVIIVIHLLIVIALIGVVLIQRSEGGGLGIGGGSGFMTARGTKNVLTRLTAILGGCFFLTSLILYALSASTGSTSDDILDPLTKLNNAAPAPADTSFPAALDNGATETQQPAQDSAPAATQDPDQPSSVLDGLGNGTRSSAPAPQPQSAQ